MEKPLRGEGRGEPPEASFLSLILFLTTIASQHLGLVKNPLTDKVEPNLELAKYSIDTLDMLKKKTKGNLNKEEQELLEGMISNLKLTYVKLKSNPPKTK
ncbi:DUF1844 domain-containing protein [candidate division WOR-3 bacterium]|nr:DUF1844 domain-containing protein [candidate division WOR-3 bacterium]